MLTTDPPNSQTFLRNCYLYHTLADKDQIRYKNLRIPIHQWPPLWQFNQVGCLTGGIYLSYQRVRVRRSEHNWTASQPVTGLVETNHCQTRWTSRKMVFCYQNCSDLLWEKKCSSDQENLLQNLKIWTIYSNSERSKEFWITECFLTSSWRFLIYIWIRRIQIQIQIGKKIRDLEPCRKYCRVRTEKLHRIQVNKSQKILESIFYREKIIF